MNNHDGTAIWLTGLSGAGKSTIAQGLLKELKSRGLKVELFDGDMVRKNLTKGLGFSKEDRDENIRRIGFVADLLTRNGVIAIVAAISPYKSIRNEVRAKIEKNAKFLEVFVKAPLEVCEERDVKGLYKKARTGEIKNFTGISDPYEEPENAEVICETDKENETESIKKILEEIC